MLLLCCRFVCCHHLSWFFAIYSWSVFGQYPSVTGKLLCGICRKFVRENFTKTPASVDERSSRCILGQLFSFTWLVIVFGNYVTGMNSTSPLTVRCGVGIGVLRSPGFGPASESEFLFRGRLWLWALSVSSGLLLILLQSAWLLCNLFYN